MLKFTLLFMFLFTSLVYAENLIERLEKSIDQQIELSEKQADQLNTKILELSSRLNREETRESLGLNSNSEEIQDEIDELQEIQSEILISISQLKLKKEFYFSAR